MIAPRVCGHIPCILRDHHNCRLDKCICLYHCCFLLSKANFVVAILCCDGSMLLCVSRGDSSVEHCRGTSVSNNLKSMSFTSLFHSVSCGDSRIARTIAIAQHLARDTYSSRSHEAKNSDNILN